MESINSLPLIETQNDSISNFNPSQIVFKGKRIDIKKNPIFRNNYFLSCYNTNYNKVAGITLKKLPRNKIYYCLFPILNIKYFFLHVIFAFMPYFNLFWQVFLIFMWLVYEKAYFVYRANRKKVRFPLKNMIFDPNLCRFYKCMNKFLEIPAGYLNSANSSEFPMQQRVTVMIYNENFKRMHTFFPYYRYFHLAHIVFSSLCILFSYFLMYKALKLNRLLPFT